MGYASSGSAASAGSRPAPAGKTSSDPSPTTIQGHVSRTVPAKANHSDASTDWRSSRVAKRRCATYPSPCPLLIHRIRIRHRNDSNSSEDAFATLGTRSSAPAGALGASRIAAAIPGGPPKRFSTIPREGDRAQHSGHELEQVGDHDAPQPRRDRVDEREPHAHREGQRGVPSEQHVAEFDHCQHHPPHDDRVLHQPLVDGREAPQDPRGGAAVADLDDLGVGEDARAAPQPRIEEGQHEDPGRLVPPQPVAVHALAADQRGGGERRIGGEPGGRDRGAREPPGQGPAGDEIVLNAASRAFGEAQADGEGYRAVDGDDYPVDGGEGHLGRWLASTGAGTDGMGNRNLTRYAASATCVRDAPVESMAGTECLGLPSIPCEIE